MRIALALFLVIIFAAPASAATPSRACVAAIKSANVRHRAIGIRPDCWRIGLLTLGMSQVAGQGVMGPPEAARDIAINYRRQKYPLHEALYVYPRNLKSWLRLAPEPLEHFHAVTLHLFYWKDSLVAIRLGSDARIDSAPCTPSLPTRPFERGGADYPFDFHGIALGAPMAAVSARFGRFAGTNRSRDFFNYWPVPLSFGGEGRVNEIGFSTGMAFAGIGGVAQFQLRRDPQTCLVRDYTVSLEG